MHSQKLELVDEAKYLGIIIHKKLSWKPQIDSVVKKANQTRAFLQRNLRTCSQDVKAQCYKTHVRPITEYVQQYGIQLVKAIGQTVKKLRW